MVVCTGSPEAQMLMDRRVAFIARPKAVAIHALWLYQPLLSYVQ